VPAVHHLPPRPPRGEAGASALSPYMADRDGHREREREAGRERDTYRDA
jgi:hypothetical protein